jgi:hypothetical protein
MEQEQFDKLKLITSLMRIGHGNLDEYYKIGLPVVRTDPNLFAHLIAWNHKNGKVYDSKIAFPIIALRGDPQFAENAIAHLCSLNPRQLARAYGESKKLTANGNNIKGRQSKTLRWAIQKYLSTREKNRKWWDSCVVQNRKAMKELYAVSHRKPVDFVQNILFDNQYPPGSVFEIIRTLKNMSAKEAAGHIINHRIPLTVAIGSVSSIKDSNILLALLEGISGNELLNNTAMFERLGVNNDAVLKSAYEAAIERAKKDKKVNIYKASKAIDSIKDEKLKKKVILVQQEQEKKQKGIEGDWLILGDCSGSMEKAIEVARRISALIASQIKGKVYLVYFNESPKFFDVSGMDYQTVFEKTKTIVAYGRTNIGCGLDYITQKNIIINGIVIVSDGGDNCVPFFPDVYKAYTQKYIVEPTVYHLWVPGDENQLRSVPYIQHIDISKNFDEYAYSNLLNILKANKYQLFDDILDTPLLTFSKVFKGENYAD